MRSEDFFKEVLNSDICPDNFRKTYSDFKKYQKKALDTLNEFHRVCEKYGIIYQLMYGSLLGAIRDDGQIPWDYDVDVFVSYSDKNRLIEALRTDLNENFFFYCPEINSECRHVIMRVAPVGYDTEGVHVDVFYYVGTCNDEVARKKHIEDIKKATYARLCKLSTCRRHARANIKSVLSIIKRKIPYLLVPMEKIESSYIEACERYNFCECSICVSADRFADWYEIPKEYLLSTKLIENENGVFRVSTKYDLLLRILYGDYEKIPPLNDRIKEVEEHLYVLKKYTK